MCLCLVREQVGRHGNSSVGLSPVTPIPSPHSYIENQQHLQHLELRDLRGLGELRNL